jgi:hypothetical protein
MKEWMKENRKGLLWTTARGPKELKQSGELYG